MPVAIYRKVGEGVNLQKCVPAEFDWTGLKEFLLLYGPSELSLGSRFSLNRSKIEIGGVKIIRTDIPQLL